MLDSFSKSVHHGDMEKGVSHKGITTYLLGAGASANSLPIVSEYSNRFKVFIDFLKNHEIAKQKKKEIEEVCKDFIWLIDLIKDKKSSVDSIAKDFFEKKEFGNLKKLKKLLVFFFIIEQTSNPSKKVDKRYLPFIDKIWPGNRSNLPSNQVRILNWNYDFQVEMALADLANYSNHFDLTDLQRQCLPSPLYMHEDSIPDYYESFAIDQFSICHLNGICYCHKYDYREAHNTQSGSAPLPFNQIFDPFDKSLKSIEETLVTQVFNYINLLNRKGHSTALEFAWEKPENDRPPNNIRKKVFDKAIEATQGTKILIVIGYSFPKENSEFDKKIIASMESLKMVFIQDPHAGKIKTNLLKTCNKYIKEAKVSIWMNDDINDFFVPFF